MPNSHEILPYDCSLCSFDAALIIRRSLDAALIVRFSISLVGASIQLRSFGSPSLSSELRYSSNRSVFHLSRRSFDTAPIVRFSIPLVGASIQLQSFDSPSLSPELRYSSNRSVLRLSRRNFFTLFARTLSRIFPSFFYFYIDKLFGMRFFHATVSCQPRCSSNYSRFSISLVETSLYCLRERYRESFLLSFIFIDKLFGMRFFHTIVSYTAAMQLQLFGYPSLSSKLLHIASSSCLIIFKLSRAFLLDAHQRYVTRTSLRLGCLKSQVSNKRAKIFTDEKLSSPSKLRRS